MEFAKIDVIIPCYNARHTLQRAVDSVLQQSQLGCLWIIDDGSQDDSLQIAEQLAKANPERIKVEKLPHNVGVAKARNWGALQSGAEFIAFLDADDAYEPNALTYASSVFYFRPEIALVRLRLKPVDLAASYHQHEKFAYAWQVMQMTGAGNVVFRRAFFLACGGFPQQPLFRELGGEDGALGIAATQVAAVATLFDEAGVLHYCREGMHAERLLDAILFDKHHTAVTPEKMAQANEVTAQIVQQINQLTQMLKENQSGIFPLTIERG